MKNRVRKLIITDNVPGNTEDDFKRSTCDCSFCKDIHKAQTDWNNYKPKTPLQKNMMKTIASIETRANRCL